MSTLDALRRTEHQVQEAAKRGKELVSAGIHTLEERVLRTLHLKSGSRQTSGRKSRLGIVSVNGQDVEKIRCTGRRS